MPDVTTFNLGGQDITVKDPAARSNAQMAANTAKEALQKVKDVEQLSRITVTYAPATETITISTVTHTTNASTK